MKDSVALLNDWHVVARSQDLAEDAVLSARVLGEALVLWRSGGRAQAWTDLCAHRGARLSLGRVAGDCLVCPYHGWRYDGEGRCVLMPAHPDQTPPARARAATHHARERYGFVWVCLGTPARDIAPFPEWDDPAFRKVYAGPFEWSANGFRIVENFLDASHFPFVHTDLLGDPAVSNEIQDYRVDLGPEGLSTSPIKVWQSSADVSGRPAYSLYSYRVYRPLTAYFSKDTGEGKRFTTLLDVQPIDDGRSVLWLCVTMNFGHDIPDQTVRERQDVVYGQDKRIVETQRPEILPLDLSAEIHVRSDRLAVEYRKWLKQLGVDTGAAASDTARIRQP